MRICEGLVFGKVLGGVHSVFPLSQPGEQKMKGLRIHSGIEVAGWNKKGRKAQLSLLMCSLGYSASQSL